MERQQVKFSGRVQGVGFRATVRSVARGYEISGWVRNEADGSVLLEAQGKAGQVQAFLEAIRGRMDRYIQDERHAPASVATDESGFVITH